MNKQNIVQVQQGALQGIHCQTVYKIPFIVFLDVPYAAPPIGDLRFKDPQPPPFWEGIRNCQIFKNNCCIQYVTWPYSGIIGDEDCLYLNIYLPLRLKRRIGTAVMVWIHGGHYMNGSGNFGDAQPDYFMDRDIILVTVNYRLGAFGFLNLQNEQISGNQGLKDQVAALQWIKENIAAFGGNPNNVTLFGSNVGAKCVHLLMLSPLSKDLFHKAILQSGVATMNWAIEDGSTIRRSFDLASYINRTTSNTGDVITSLKTVDASEIISAQYKILRPEEMEVKEIFGPSIDTFSERPFFPRPLGELLDNGNQKPVILGYTSLEYMRFFKECTLRDLQSLYIAIPSYTRMLLPLDASPRQTEMLAKRVQKYYFNSTLPTTLSSFWDVLQCYSDICFNLHIKLIANIRRMFAEAPTYLYEFSYVGNNKIVNKNLYWYNANLSERVSVSTQYDDVAYLFYLPAYKHADTIFPLQRQTADYKMMKVMTNMWTSFALIGDPTPEHTLSNCKWKPATSENFYYLDIDRECRLLTVASHDPLQP